MQAAQAPAISQVNADPAGNLIIGQIFDVAKIGFRATPVDLRASCVLLNNLKLDLG